MPSLAQTFEIKGRVLGDENKAIEIANVFLYQDSIYVNGIITKQDGTFSFTVPKGNYTVKVSLIGYEPTSRNVSVSKNVQVQDIVLKEETIKLNDVTVVGKKPLIKREIDRVVYDISNLPSSIGGSVADILSDMPGIQVSRDNIGIVGKGKVKIYINGREMKLSGSDLVSYINSYSASSIKKVEVITTPPAKYEAEGDYGIINFILEKAKNDYVGGTTSTSYLYSEKESYGYSSLNLKYNKNKLSAFFNVSGHYGHVGYVERLNNYYSQQTWTNSTNVKCNVENANIEGGVELACNKNWTIGLQGMYSKAKPDIENECYTNIFPAEYIKADSTIISNVVSKQDNTQKSLNFHIDKEIDKLGKKMSLDVDYLHYKQDYNQQFRATGADANGISLPSLNNSFDDDENRTVNSVSSKLDIALPFEKFKLNFGGKVSYMKTENTLFYLTTDLPDSQNDHFIYQENIYALYADYSQAYSKKSTIKFGLRTEYTYTSGESVLLNLKNNDNYFHLFPTFYYQYNPNDNNSLTFSFTSRISRPSNNALNPSKLYNTKYSYNQGKPDLQPYYTYNSELNYTYKNNLNLSIYYSQKENVYAPLSIIDTETKVAYSIWDNYIKSKTFGITNSYTFNICNWMSNFIDHRLFYNKIKSTSLTTALGDEGWTYSISLRNTFYFNRQKTLAGTLSGSYNSKERSNMWVFEPTYDVAAGFRYNLLKNKLHLRLTVRNLIASNYKGTYNTNGVVQKCNNTFSYLNGSIGVSYDLGVKISSSKRRYSNEDIRQRL